ncbi:MAG: PhoX family protein [Rubrobacter sp.]
MLQRGLGKVQRIKKDKRDRDASVESGLSRRSFLTYLGAGSAALAAGSTGILTGKEAAAQQFAGGASTPFREDSVGHVQLFFNPIEATDADELVLPEGFQYNVVCRWGEEITSDGQQFGYNNDYIAYFPIDALEGGRNSYDGLLFVNHEYVDSKWVSGFDDSDDEDDKRTPEQIAVEKAAVGGAVLRVLCDEHGVWQFAIDDDYNRRIDATTPICVTGPAAGSPEMKMEGEDEVTGTLANCSGGVTPWNTVLSCEENFQGYYGEATNDEGISEDDELQNDADWAGDDALPPEHYGWVVEVDPFDRSSKPRKHTWLGRVRHENVAINVAPSGRVVAYTGHDEPDQCIYKFISSGVYDPNNRAANMELLADGMLYVADFANGRWVAMDFENNPIFADNDFTSQAQILVRTPEAAALEDPETEAPIGTPLDRCEDIEVHPDDGTIYAALTNNSNHGNFHGQIIRMFEADADPEATEFTFETFGAGGQNTGFSSPDNLAFDRRNHLWMVTDMSSSVHNKGIYETFKNNGMFVMPSINDDSIMGEQLAQFASGPVECEMTGPAFTPDGSTLFLAVQHPGEESESVENPSSTWPHDGDGIPKPSIVAITGFA